MTVERNARVTDPFIGAMRGLVRRMSVSRAGAVLWQLVGFRVGRHQEAQTAEVFHGVGIHSIPSANGKPEAIVINIGGAAAPVIIATRDEATRAATTPHDMVAGETVIYSEGAIVYLRNGTVEVRTPAGAAKRLLTVDDGAALKQAIATAAVVATDGGAALKANIVGNLSSWPTGTTVLKGQ